MATFFLSQHSSNPLEVPSSDVTNSKQLHQIQALGGIVSSDDPPDGYHRTDMQDYRDHMSQWFPNMNYTTTKKLVKNKTTPQPPPLMVDLDEDMSDGETQPYDAAMTGYAEELTYHNSEEEEEEKSILLKPPEEREEIEEEIIDLEEAVPELREEYQIIDRLGTGTFSSVYKAIDLWYHTSWDNTPWQNHHPSDSSAYYQSMPRPKGSKVFVAIKRIYVTSGPERIRNEISIMEDCRGCRHVSQLVTAFRNKDQVVAIMPFHRNEDFRDYYRYLSLDAIKAYFRCMFRALRDIHSRGIIHRDVKPANFLFDPRTGIGTLCDFGLACRMERGPNLGACLHTGPTPENPHGRIRPRRDYDSDAVRKMQKEARYRSTLPSDKVGYPEKETRPHSKANRAGTRGFRAPEVLLKCGEQSGAIDVWSTGIIFIFFLTAKFPLFQSNDDIEALMELSTILGIRKMERVATLHSRTFTTNVPSITPDGISWSDFIKKLNPNLMTPTKPDTRFYPYSNRPPIGVTGPPPTSSSSSSPPSFHSSSRSSSSSKPEFLSQDSAPPAPSTECHEADVNAALDLVEKMLNPDATRRITPLEALKHPFLSEEDEGIDDDDYFPHPFGGGVCGELHFYDETTEEPCVQVTEKGGKMGLKRLIAGEGIAIGKSPCEFHKNYYDVE